MKDCRNPDEKLQLSEHLIQDAVNSTHFKPLENDLKCFIQIIYPQNEIGNYRKSTIPSLEQNIMKILMYSIYAFDKPFIENATHGKLEFAYTNQIKKTR
jgi:hypothetical protein